MGFSVYLARFFLVLGVRKKALQLSNDTVCFQRPALCESRFECRSRRRAWVSLQHAALQRHTQLLFSCVDRREKDRNAVNNQSVLHK